MAGRPYRKGFDHVPGHLRAARLLQKHSGEHYVAWNALEIFDHNAAEEYLGDPALVAARQDPVLAGRVMEVALMFAMTAVMADRELREEEEFIRQQVKTHEEREEGEEPDGDDPIIPF